MPNVIPVILCGGSGTRLWPISRETYPKQFVELSSSGTLFQQTVKRCANSISDVAPVVICNEAHRFIVAEQLLESSCENATILLEPEGKNTAPAIALAALIQTQDPILVIMPSDHIIFDTKIFKEAISNAINLASKDYIVTLGVQPAHPAIGYGYIKAGTSLEAGYNVEHFIEKPPLESAKEFIKDGGYFWNAGIFVFKSSVYLAALEKHAPEILNCCHEAILKAEKDMDFVRINKDSFLPCPSISIDYAVMEHAQLVAVVPLMAGWSDVGSWNSWWDMLDKCERGNAIEGDVVMMDVENCLIRAESRLVAAAGVQNLIVIETADAVLIASRENDQKIKALVKKLGDRSRTEVVSHRRVHRPWGTYEPVDLGHRYQVKRITVKPGAKLSLQKHEHRAEHWVVVKGVATVTRGNDVFLVSENESTFIPVGVAHRLENASTELLEIIEVQSGNYLGEDDIVRLEDSYGRA
jgi:mannose-1-phosphate guanylyltransferase